MMRFPFVENAVRALSLSSEVQKPIGSILNDGSLHLKAELPGDSPFSLCEVSRPTDLFEIKSVQLSKQPIYMCVFPCNDRSELAVTYVLI